MEGRAPVSMEQARSLRRGRWAALAEEEEEELRRREKGCSKCATIAGFLPLLVVVVATGAHIQHLYRERFRVPPAAVGAAWAATSVAAAVVELALVVARVPRSSIGTVALSLAWFVSTLALWRPWHGLDEGPDGIQGGALAASSSSFAAVLTVHGATQAVLQIQWASLFPAMFVTRRERAWGSWCKQIASTGALLTAMSLVPALSGPDWSTSEHGATLVVSAAAVFSVFAAAMLGSGADPDPGEEAAAARLGGSSAAPAASPGRAQWLQQCGPRCQRQVASVWFRLSASPSLRSFLVSDALAVVGNSMLTALFPLYCRVAAGMAAKPERLDILPAAVADALPDWAAEWTSLELLPAAHIPTAYAVFYITSTLCGPVWAWAGARMDLVTLWQAETAGYVLSLCLLLVADSFSSVLIASACMGACASGFTLLPEILVARLVDESDAKDEAIRCESSRTELSSGASLGAPGAADARALGRAGTGGRGGGDGGGGQPRSPARSSAQSIVASKSLCRRAASALQGLLVAWVLSWAGYTPGVGVRAQGGSVAWSLRLATVAVPALFFGLAGVALSWYKLGDAEDGLAVGGLRGPGGGLSGARRSRPASPSPQSRSRLAASRGGGGWGESQPLMNAARTGSLSPSRGSDASLDTLYRRLSGPAAAQAKARPAASAMGDAAGRLGAE